MRPCCPGATIAATALDVVFLLLVVSQWYYWEPCQAFCISSPKAVDDALCLRTPTELASSPRITVVDGDSQKKLQRIQGLEKIGGGVGGGDDGGVDEQTAFDYLTRVDKTVRALQKQLPSLLTSPLTLATADEVYDRDGFSLKVLVNPSEDDRTSERNDDNNAEEIIDVMNGLDELLSLSDVLVVGTAAAGRANAALTGGLADTKVEIDCQLILDDSFSTIRVPWTAAAPVLGSPTDNMFEGLSDFVLSQTNGQVEAIVMRRLYWNKQPVAIGQAIKTIRSIGNWQQASSMLQLPWQQIGELRDVLLEQAVAAATQESAVANNNQTLPTVYKVNSIAQFDKWFVPPEKQQTPVTPYPGTEAWEQYAASRTCMQKFCNEVVPQLSELSIVSPDFFSQEATFVTEDGSILMKGRGRLANFYQSMALTRKGTFSSWEHTSFEVIDWKNRSVAVEYKVRSTLPQQEWTITGRDVYALEKYTTKEDLPVVASIRQGPMTIKANNGGIASSPISLDSKWLMENIVFALERQMDSGDNSVFARDFVTEIIMSQPSVLLLFGTTKPSSAAGNKRREKQKLSPSTAANCFYIMTALQDEGLALFNLTKTRTLPPASEYMSDNIELQGYLGEKIAVGKRLYNSGIGSVLLGLRDSIRQKRVTVENVDCPRVELLPSTSSSRGGVVLRSTSALTFRIPSPGAGVILPDSLSSGPPVKLELTSDYRVNADTGLIVEHRLVETRVNGQLTPGDQLSRWMRRFLNVNEKPPTVGAKGRDTNGDVLKAISDALLWFRSINGS